MNKQKLIEDIQQFYGDTSRSREETRDVLEELRDQIDLLIESLGD